MAPPIQPPTRPHSANPSAFSLFPRSRSLRSQPRGTTTGEDWEDAWDSSSDKEDDRRAARPHLMQSKTYSEGLPPPPPGTLLYNNGLSSTMSESLAVHARLPPGGAWELVEPEEVEEQGLKPTRKAGEEAIRKDVENILRDPLELLQSLALASPTSAVSSNPPSSLSFPFFNQPSGSSTSEIFASSSCSAANQQTTGVSRQRSVRTERRRENFAKVLQREDGIDLGELRRLAWSGVPHEVRPIVWQLLLNYLPLPVQPRLITLNRKRKEYLALVDQYFGKGLSSLNQQQIWHQIEIDVPRTRPGVLLWSCPETQRSLERILYVWAIRHPASGYVQGINDLVTPFFEVFLSAYIDTDPEIFDLSYLPSQILNAIEADSFWCLSKLLDGIQDHYISQQPGIQRLVKRMSDLVKRIDAPLAAHFEQQGVEFMQFAFRWMNCLLMREISVKCTIRMWDTYLTEGTDAFSQFHLYVCSALLVKWSERLREMDFQEMIIFLQCLPTQQWTDYDIELLLSEAYVLKTVWQGAENHFKDLPRPPKPKAGFKAPVPAQKSSKTITQQITQAAVPAQAQIQPQRNKQEVSNAATSQDQQIVTKQESLAILKTALEASLGSICYLRRLLPDDQFIDTYMASSVPMPDKSLVAQYGLSQPDPNGSQQPGGGKGFKYPRIRGDGSQEGAKLLRMIEGGVMDAVTKGYLQSFMFIIFLDKNDPSNIVESYTFNFFYSYSSGECVPTLEISHTIDGHDQPPASNSVLPEKIETSEELNMPKTHQDVRRAIKGLLKTLILGAQRLVDLPRQRYVDFKLSYNDTAPVDYEAPGFKDCTNVPLYMCTNIVDEAPTALQIGSTATGIHGVSLTTLSIAEYLPSRLDSEGYFSYDAVNDNLEEERLEQMLEAGRRKVAWSADLPVYDRKAYEPSSFDPYSLIVPQLAASSSNKLGLLKQPLGKMLDDGTIEPIVRPGEQFGLSLTSGHERNKGKKRNAAVLEEELLELSATQCSPTPFCEADIHPRATTGLYDHDAEGETDYGGSQWIVHENADSSTQVDPPVLSLTSSPHALQKSIGRKSKSTGPKDNNSKQIHESPTKDKPTRKPSRQKPKKTNPQDAPEIKSQRSRKVSKAVPNISAVATPIKRTSQKPKSKSRKTETKTPSKVFIRIVTSSIKTPPSKQSQTNFESGTASSPTKKRKKDAPPLGTQAVEKTANNSKVNCFCGSQDEIEGTMRCVGCENWMHCCCVGLSELKAAAQVEDWYCLICQMEKDNSKSWKKIDVYQAREDCRRVLLEVRQKGGIGNASSHLRDAWGCSMMSLKKCFVTLYQEGFIDGEHGKRHKKNAFYNFVHTPETAKRFMEYFQPGGGVESELFDFCRTNKGHAAEQVNNTLADSQDVLLPCSTRPLTLTSSLTPVNAIKTPFGNFLPSLDGQPISQYTLPVIRSSRAQSPIELLEDW
nr:tbc1 domain family protein [Cryptococcus depauperatus CBS 7841]